MKPCNQNIKELIHLSENLLDLANKGDIERNDDGCGIMYGIARDCAYKLKKLAEEEIETHKRKNKWD